MKMWVQNQFKQSCKSNDADDARTYDDGTRTASRHHSGNLGRATMTTTRGNVTNAETMTRTQRRRQCMLRVLVRSDREEIDSLVRIAKVRRDVAVQFKESQLSTTSVEKMA